MSSFPFPVFAPGSNGPQGPNDWIFMAVMFGVVGGALLGVLVWRIVVGRRVSKTACMKCGSPNVEEKRGLMICPDCDHIEELP
jgi:hypothetical protein